MKLLRHAIPLIFHNHLAEMTYFVTSKCNYRCQHCFMLNKLNKRENELSVNEIKKMSRHIRPLQRVHIGGGEPFLRKDISEIIQTISQNWESEVICLPTNGSIQDNLLNTVKDFAQKCTRQLRLHFSLNTLDEDFKKFTCSNDSFQDWKQTFKMAKSLTENVPNITLLALLTYNDFNQAYFDSLLDFVTTKLCPDDVSLGLVRSHKRYNPTLDIEGYTRIVEHFFSNSSKQNALLKAYRSSIRNYMAEYYSTGKSAIKCYSGKMRVVMSPEGNIYPCETSGYPENENPTEWLMGNIRDFDYNIQALLKSCDATAIRKSIEDRRCHCSQGIDMSLSLLCNNFFKAEVLLKSIKTLFVNCRK